MPKAPKFDAADYLDSKEAIADYLGEAFATGDNEIVTRAISTVARASGMSFISE